MLDFTSTKIELEELLLLIKKYEDLGGKRGSKVALRYIRSQSMVVRRNLQSMRADILASLKTDKS